MGDRVESQAISLHFLHELYLRNKTLQPYFLIGNQFHFLLFEALSV